VWTDFKILEVKVPVIFSGTEGFPAHRDRRYKVLCLIIYYKPIHSIILSLLFEHYSRLKDLVLSGSPW
jgi:hypothetical protein